MRNDKQLPTMLDVNSSNWSRMRQMLSAEVDRPGRVLIEIVSNCLYVANTGQPFRLGGVTSLMTAHASDEPIRTARMIGAKGLRFRAILIWTDTPLISSGALELGFSQRHAAAQVSDLARQSPSLAYKLARAKSDRPPLLVFPAIGADLEDNLDRRHGGQCFIMYEAYAALAATLWWRYRSETAAQRKRQSTAREFRADVPPLRPDHPGIEFSFLKPSGIGSSPLAKRSKVM